MKDEKGLTLIEVLIIVAIIGIIAAITIPNVHKMLQANHEASAVKSVREIGTAQARYQATVGQGENFAPDLATLGREGIVEKPLAESGVKDGYSFVTKGVPATNFWPSYFDTTADPNPARLGAGSKHFYANEMFVVWQSENNIEVPGVPAFRQPNHSTVVPLE
jgi:prepilin-type N-terminal cleavage/methylation domain-containing protein